MDVVVMGLAEMMEIAIVFLVGISQLIAPNGCAHLDQLGLTKRVLRELLTIHQNVQVKDFAREKQGCVGALKVSKVLHVSAQHVQIIVQGMEYV